MTLEQYMEVLPLYMKDDPRTNKLTQASELSPEEYRLALIMALEDFNNTPPLISTWTFPLFPAPGMLLMGAAIRCLDMAIAAKNRNRLPYSDAGLSVDDDGQAPQYMQMRSMLSQEYEQKKLNYKRALNVEQCFGGSPSEYSVIYPYTNRPVK